jgi:hypothetical protein
MANDFLTTASAVKEIIQRELEMREFSRRWVPRSLIDAHKVVRAEAAKNVKDFAEVRNE